MSFFNSISYKIQNVDIFALRRSYTISEEAHYYNLYKKKFKVYMPRRRFIDHNRIRRALIGLPSVHKGLRKGIKT